jgi:cytoskeletal protein RodZ
VTLSLPPTFPPIRPGWLTRLANRLGLRRTELVTALWSLAAGAPIAATAVLIATVPVPQTPGHPFDPAPATIAPSEPAAEPTQESSRAPVAALTASGRAPRVIAPTEAARPSRTATAPRPTPSATTEPAPSTSAPTTAPEPSTSAPTTEPTVTLERSPTAGLGAAVP